MLFWPIIFAPGEGAAKCLIFYTLSHLPPIFTIMRLENPWEYKVIPSPGFCVFLSLMDPCFFVKLFQIAR